MTGVLFAWLEGRLVGRFTDDGPGSAMFAYDDKAGPTPVSLSMPRAGGWAKTAPYRFLDNLLPDEQRTRARIAHDTDASSDSVFDLLAQIGTDVAGGLVLTADGQPPQRHAGPMIPVGDDDIAFRIATLRADPDRWIDRDLAGGRFSLAGAQAKFALARSGSRWFQPSPALPSTHIVKPDPARFPDAGDIEHATMRLAQLSGVPAAETGILQVFGERAFITERFDRDTSVTPAVRVHAEDFAQASGMPRGRKYGLTAVQAVAMLRRHDPDDVLGYQFADRLAFAAATGNCDAHAKNFTVLLRPDSVTLAPAYDQIATLFWPGLDSRLAMKIGGADRSAAVTPGHWAKFARTSDLDADRVVAAARAMSATVMQAARQAAEVLAPGIRDKFLSVIADANRGMVRGTSSPAGAPRCSMCGRPLSSAASLARGMGPGCAAKGGQAP